MPKLISSSKSLRMYITIVTYRYSILLLTFLIGMQGMRCVIELSPINTKTLNSNTDFCICVSSCKEGYPIIESISMSTAEKTIVKRACKYCFYFLWLLNIKLLLQIFTLLHAFLIQWNKMRKRQINLNY